MRFLQQWKQDGNWRIRFRRDGFKPCELPTPPGHRGDKATLGNSQEFLTAYLAAMSAEVAPVAPGEKRAAHGTVAWLVTEYFASLDFTGRPPSIREKHRRYLEAFRQKHGDKIVSVKRGEMIVPIIDQEMVEKWFAKLIDTPMKANKWLSAMRDLFAYAIKRKLLTGNPADGLKRRKAKVHISEDGEAEEGHHTWTLAEVAKAREKFPIGTEMRLAIELINALALRRSDAIRVGLPNTYAGHLDDGRPATFLRYVQWKNREIKPVTIDTPIPADLLDIIKATKKTGLKT
jgi:hypothetical protein